MSLTKVDVGLAGASAADPGGSGDGAALLERDELVEMVEIGEHLSEKDDQHTLTIPHSRSIEERASSIASHRSKCRALLTACGVRRYLCVFVGSEVQVILF